ncbi:MAG: V-type ATP synthase subunit E, partial [Waddliaceae bacterium]
MEKTLEKGEDKIQQICDALRKETLMPAKQEAEKLVEEGKRRAEQVVKEAHAQADKILAKARETIDQERNVFHSSLEQAGKQSLQELRQVIENKLFHQELQKIVNEQSSDPKVIAKLIASIIEAIEREGISTKLSAVVPEAVSTEEVNRLLGERIVKKLSEKSVSLGEFVGGAQVKLLDKKMTIDITDDAVMELLS